VRPRVIINCAFLTSYERDNETELDYAGERYYSSSLGRFSSPDKPFVDQDRIYPQSWNIYVYTRNNPLRYIDESGEEITYATPEIKAVSDALRQKSTSYDNALKGFEGKDSPDLLVQFGDAGKDANGIDKAVGLTTTSITPEGQDGSDVGADNDMSKIKIIPAKLNSAIITIDTSIQNDVEKVEDTLGHETGHADDARRNPQTYADNSEKTRREKGKTPHDKRPNEIVANNFEKRVKAERTAFVKAEKERKKAEEKQRKQEEKQRKKP